MSRSSADILNQLQAINPLFGRESGSQTLKSLAERNNLSRETVQVYAQAEARAREQQRIFQAQQAEQQERDRVASERNANVRREAQDIFSNALDSLGDESQQQIYADQGTLSTTVRERIQGQFDALRANGNHVDENGNLTFEAESIFNALQQTEQGASRELQQAGSAEQLARQQGTADRNANSGALRNFVQSTGVNALQGLAGLGFQVGAAGAGAFGADGLANSIGERAAATDNFLRQFDITSAGESRFNNQFAEAEGFGESLAALIENPGGALQSLGAGTAGALVGGGGVGAAARIGARGLGRLAGRGASTAAPAAARTGVAGRSLDAAQAAALPTFVGGGAGFGAGAQEALDSDTDDIGSFAQRGLATSGASTLAAGALGGLGLNTIDALNAGNRARAANLLPTRFNRQGQESVGAANSLRNVRNEAGRTVLGESIEEGVQGSIENVSEQIGQGQSLSQLDLGAVGDAFGQGAAAGGFLGGVTGAGTGSTSTLQRRRATQASIRDNIQQATGGTDNAVNAGAIQRGAVGQLDAANIDNFTSLLGASNRAGQTAAINSIVADFEANDLAPGAVRDIIDRSTTGGGLSNRRRIDGDLLRQNLGAQIGVPISLDAEGLAGRTSDPLTASPEADGSVFQSNNQPIESQSAVNQPVAAPSTDDVLNASAAPGEIDTTAEVAPQGNERFLPEQTPVTPPSPEAQAAANARAERSEFGPAPRTFGQAQAAAAGRTFAQAQLDATQAQTDRLNAQGIADAQRQVGQSEVDLLLQGGTSPAQTVSEQLVRNADNRSNLLQSQAFGQQLADRNSQEQIDAINAGLDPNQVAGGSINDLLIGGRASASGVATNVADAQALRESLAQQSVATGGQLPAAVAERSNTSDPATPNQDASVLDSEATRQPQEGVIPVTPPPGGTQPAVDPVALVAEQTPTADTNTPVADTAPAADPTPPQLVATTETASADPLVEEALADNAGVQREIQANAGQARTPQTQAQADFTSDLFRAQVASGVRGVGPNQTAEQQRVANQSPAQLDIARRIDAGATREEASAAYRAERDADVERRAGLIAVPQQATNAQTDNTTVESEGTSTPVTTPENVGFSIDQSNGNTLTIDGPFANALLATFAPASIRRKQTNEAAGTLIRTGKATASDAVASSAAAANATLKRIRTELSKIYTLPNDKSFDGQGTRTFTPKKDSITDAQVRSTQENVSGLLNDLQGQLTPEGFQRILGKKP